VLLQCGVEQLAAAGHDQHSVVDREGVAVAVLVELCAALLAGLLRVVALDQLLELVLVPCLDGRHELVVIGALVTAVHERAHIWRADHELVAEQGLDVGFEVEVVARQAIFEALGHLVREREPLSDLLYRLHLVALGIGLEGDDQRRILGQVAERVVERASRASVIPTAAGQGSSADDSEGDRSDRESDHAAGTV
jgi:hypothetical protein